MIISQISNLYAMLFVIIFVISCSRYNIHGFVEELPKLPEKRDRHACAVLPLTGVRPSLTRPSQPTLCRHLLLLEEWVPVERDFHLF